MQLEEALRRMKLVAAEGDLDGVAAGAVMVDTLGLPGRVYDSRRLRAVQLERVIAVELSPIKLGALVDSILIDHHELTGVYYFRDSTLGKPVKLFEPRQPPRSALDVAVEMAELLGGTKPPREVIEAIARIEQGDTGLWDAVFVGYQLLHPWRKWRQIAIGGVNSLVHVLNMFKRFGEAYKYTVEAIASNIILTYTGERVALATYARPAVIIIEPEPGVMVPSRIHVLLAKAVQLELRKRYMYALRYNVSSNSAYASIIVGCDNRRFSCNSRRLVTMLARHFAYDGYSLGSYGGRETVAAMKLSPPPPPRRVLEAAEKLAAKMEEVTQL